MIWTTLWLVGALVAMGVAGAAMEVEVGVARLDLGRRKKA